MRYEPKILINNTDKTVEFFCGNEIHIFKPGEQKPIDGFAAYHALKQVNTGLVEVGTANEVKTDVPLEEMSWKDLRMMKGKDGKKVYEMGMNRKDLIEAIKKAI